jgi:uncharacterized protein GlcG (DUF336 family)
MKVRGLCVAWFGVVMVGNVSAALAADAAAPRPERIALISRADAMLAARTTMDACVKRGKHPLVVVKDARGYVWAWVSDDQTSVAGLITGNQKANAVLDFKTPGKVLMARLESDKKFAEQYGTDPRYYFGLGAYPIYKQDTLIAVLASGGGTGPIDEECVLEGLKSLPWATTEPRATKKN